MLDRLTKCACLALIGIGASMVSACGTLPRTSPNPPASITNMR